MIKINYKNIELNRDTYKLYSALYGEMLNDLSQKKQKEIEKHDSKKMASCLLRTAVNLIKKGLPLHYRLEMFWAYTFGICKNETAITYLWELADYNGVYFDIVHIIDGINSMSEKKLWKEKRVRTDKLVTSEY